MYNYYATLRAKIPRAVICLDSKPTTILATVTQGYNPVIGADVYAILESPDPSNAPTKLVLRDVGAVADIVKDDGTYSAFIFDVIERGKHSISVHVDDRKGQTKLRRLIAGSKAAENRSKFDPGTYARGWL